MKKLFLLGCLLNPINSALATAKQTPPIDQALHAEMNRLKTLSLDLKLYLPKNENPQQGLEVVEDSLSMREAAIQRQELPQAALSLKSVDRPLQQADFALESLSLDQLEAPPELPQKKAGRRYRSR